MSDSGSCHFGFRCPDGRCFPFRSGYKCPGAKCPMNQDFICNNDIRCYNDYDKCDGVDECEDGTDEAGCPVARSGGRGVPVVAIIVPVLILVLVTVIGMVVCKMKQRRQAASYRTANVVNLQPQVTAANTSLNVQLPQASYYAPGQGRGPAQQPGPYQPVHGPYQPAPQHQHPYAPPAYNEAKYYPQI